MDYSELSVYRGARIACDTCGRKFESGEVILVSNTKEGQRTFCYGDSYMGGACVESYIFHYGDALVLNPYRYGNATLPPDQQTPNNSNLIVESLRTSANPTFRNRVKAFFSSFFR